MRSFTASSKPNTKITKEKSHIKTNVTSDFNCLKDFNIKKMEFSKSQQEDLKLKLLFDFIQSGFDLILLSSINKRDANREQQTAKRCEIIDDIILYYAELMDDPFHYRIMVPDDQDSKRHLLMTYHDSLLGMHRGRDATYSSLSRDFFWKNILRNVKKWVRKCPKCLEFKTLDQKPNPMKITVYKYPFHTLGIDFVGELPCSPSGNRWILAIVCPYSNYLKIAPVKDKEATTAAKVLFEQVFLQFGFNSVLLSD